MLHNLKRREILSNFEDIQEGGDVIGNAGK
jgi:hypothetical protein